MWSLHSALDTLMLAPGTLNLHHCVNSQSQIRGKNTAGLPATARLRSPSGTSEEQGATCQSRVSFLMETESSSLTPVTSKTAGWQRFVLLLFCVLNDIGETSALWPFPYSCCSVPGSRMEVLLNTHPCSRSLRRKAKICSCLDTETYPWSEVYC